MLTYACRSTPTEKESWFVSLMEIFFKFIEFFRTGGAPCSSDQMIIHGWARNAPPLNLPEGLDRIKKITIDLLFFIDVGFAVGRNTPYKYIVVNIHYLSILKNDNSGNQIILSRTPYVDYLNRICS